MTLAKHLQTLADNIQNAVVLAQKDEPDLPTLVACMDKIAAQIETLRSEWSQEELSSHKEIYMRMQSNLETLENTLNSKSRNLQEAIGLASKRMQAHRKYAKADHK